MDQNGNTLYICRAQWWTYIVNLVIAFCRVAKGSAPHSRDLVTSTKNGWRDFLAYFGRLCFRTLKQVESSIPLQAGLTHSWRDES